MKAPRPVYRRAYLNLDSLFGHVYSNLTGEPLTPTKVATFYLLRILFQTHFGLRHKPSFYGLFHYLEKQKLFHWLYALMSSNTELTYKDYRLVTRMAFGEDREINQNFYASMEQLGSSLADINFGIEDEFYTNTYAKDPNLRWDDMDHDLVALETQDDLHFTSNFSFVYRWLKGILAQYTKTSNGDLFKLNRKMRQWILAEENNPSPIENMGAVLPYVIDCSMRARKWTNETIFNVQKDPTHTMPFDDIFNYVRIVQKRHPDVIEAFLLEAIIHIQMKDGSRGMKALKSYFELSMFELNSNMVHCMKTYRLGVPNFAPLMYSPILQARICRLFGDYPTAHVYTANKYFGRAAIALDEALILAEGTTLLGIKALIRRRMATMMMCQGRYREAQELLDYCFEEVLRHGTFIEKACLYMTAARTARFLGKDPRDFLRMARTLVHGKWPGMEKLIFSELSFLHKPDGLMPNTNRLSQVCEQFGKLTDDHPGKCDWLLL
ncbi:hypothetical protein CRE_17501 [Caenorhabditis remanei]|uniref:Uncharacterized protein n=1 Tax=Caenorhabditis remanei TaxID=31234 RepID=E3N7T8_CAERE|nr:hypothetical protein CRE_17501 [Caenorhabditis remanei]